MQEQVLLQNYELLKLNIIHYTLNIEYYSLTIRLGRIKYH